MRRYVSAITFTLSAYGSMHAAYVGRGWLMMLLAVCALLCWDDMMHEP